MIFRRVLNCALKLSLQGFIGCSYQQVNGTLPIRYNVSKEKRFIHVSSISAQSRKKKNMAAKIQKPKLLKEIEIWENITAQEVADAMNISLDNMGVVLPMVHKIEPNYVIESPKIMLKTVQKFGFKIKIVKRPDKRKTSKMEDSLFVRQPPSKPENLEKRPPVVTVMGHVDHGKTTLLDSLRNSFVVEQEFGGITQHIGAFSVEVKPGEKITFIDTPGHAAFTKMRSRGAEVTDLVVLVIAADDGVMEQTIESINIIKRAQVPLIVAVNKIDKAGAMKIDKIKEKLLIEGIQVEEKGGDVQIVPISALKKINLDLLTEVILLEAEMMKLQGDPTGLVEGVVIESKMDKNGMLATVIVKRGTLERGKIIIAGKAHARVRSMIDENGTEYKTATPSTPVQIFGWKALPCAGDEVFEVNSEKQATRIIKQREQEEMEKKIESDQEVIREKAAAEKMKRYEKKLILNDTDTFAEMRKRFFEMKLKEQNEVVKSVEKPNLKVILKGDVFGSLEVLHQILDTYKQHDECELAIFSSSVGNITITDVKNASDFDAVIYAFNVGVHGEAEPLIEEKNVDIRFHNVVYKLIDDLKDELSARIPPADAEKTLGEAEVQQHFTITSGKKKVSVAGCRCTRGELAKEALFRILREDKVVYEGTLSSMKHFKNEVKTISKGSECGLMFEEFSGKFSTGDRIVCYEKIKVKKTTSWNPGF